MKATNTNPLLDPDLSPEELRRTFGPSVGVLGLLALAWLGIDAGTVMALLDYWPKDRDAADQALRAAVDGKPEAAQMAAAENWVADAAMRAVRSEFDAGRIRRTDEHRQGAILTVAAYARESARAVFAADLLDDDLEGARALMRPFADCILDGAAVPGVTERG